MKHTRMARFGILLLLAALAGCASDPSRGYSSESVYASQIKSVAVPIFTNDTYIRSVEIQLTDALIKEIESRTPMKVTAEDRADSILTGHIRTVGLDQISKSRLTGLSEEVIVSVTIDFQWRDLRTGAPLLEREAYAGHGLFDPSNPTGESIEIGEFAAVQKLASDIVSEMQSDW